MTPGLRFTHPTIAHFRFAEECGYTLAKYGPRDYEVQDVPRGWREVRGGFMKRRGAGLGTPAGKRVGDFVVDAQRPGVPGRVRESNVAHAGVVFADGRDEVIPTKRLVHIEGDNGADSEKLWDKAAASHRVRAAFRSAGVLS
ncbi:MAG: hypothetical protein KC766_16625 [Myxococcales bacterium]|nr:hypothetical protein [Myxococcales bacterium]